MKRGLLRIWLTASLAWIVFVAIKTWLSWPVDIIWDNGISSRQETLVNAGLMASIPALVLLLSLS